MSTTPAPETTADRAVRARAGESPKSIDMPFWVDACLALDPPRKPNGAVRSGRYCLYPVVRALLADRIDARGDEAVQLDRAALARWAGHSRPDNCRWITAYLERIGFLEIHRHPGKDGPVPDTFDVFVEPPDNYVGPVSYADLDVALRDGGPRSLFAAQPQNPRAKPNPSTEGVGSDPDPATEGVGSENPRAKPNPSTEGSSRAGAFMSSLSLPPSGRSGETDRREGGGTISDRPDESATPPADAEAGDDALNTQVRDEVVRQLPWRQKHHTLSVSDENHLAAAITTAIRTYGLTLEAAREHALYKLDRATTNPVGYVTRGFQPENLPAPVSDDPFPLPSAAQTRSSAPDQPAGGVEAELPPWCGECGDGDHRAETHRSVRRFWDETAGRIVPCGCSRPGWQHNNAA